MTINKAISEEMFQEILEYGLINLSNVIEKMKTNKEYVEEKEQTYINKHEWCYKKLEEDIKAAKKQNAEIRKNNFTVYGCDLHNELFNMTFFVVRKSQAIKYLENKTWDCINLVQSYEKDNFGECSTDLSNPEKISNMVAYIVGEEILSRSSILELKWNELLTVQDLIEVKKEIESTDWSK